MVWLPFSLFLLLCFQRQDVGINHYCLPLRYFSYCGVVRWRSQKGIKFLFFGPKKKEKGPNRIFCRKSAKVANFCVFYAQVSVLPEAGCKRHNTVVNFWHCGFELEFTETNVYSIKLRYRFTNIELRTLFLSHIEKLTGKRCIYSV